MSASPESDLPLWRVRTSWASTPERRLITLFRLDPHYHGGGGYAAVMSFRTHEEAWDFVAARSAL